MRIIEQLAMGLTNKEIGRRLFISLHTVRTHLSRISKKLNTHSQAGIVGEAYRRGHLTVPKPPEVIVLPPGPEPRGPRNTASLVPVSGKDGALAQEVTRLRLTLEMARRRMGMGLLGQVIGRDTVIHGVVESRQFIEEAIGVYEVLTTHDERKQDGVQGEEGSAVQEGRRTQDHQSAQGGRDEAQEEGEVDVRVQGNSRPRR